MDSLSLQGQTLLKTKQISQHSIAFLEDRKKQFIAVANPKGINLFNLDSNKFEEEIKMQGRHGEISCLTATDDLVFFACGMTIAAAGINGKVIFEFDTYIAADRIDIVLVSGYRLWLISGNLLNQFILCGAQLNNKKSRKGVSPGQKTQDAHSHVFQSKINSCALIEEELEKPFLLILKNSNQIVCYDSKELCSFKTNSPPISLTHYDRHDRFIIGTMQGEILLIQATRKEIKKIWAIKEGSVGRVNCLMEGKNGNIIVFRDQSMEIWGADQSMLGAQEMSDKIVSLAYARQKQVAIIGASTGQVTLMCDYMQMMKNYQAKNQAKNRQTLEKEVTQLQKQLEALKVRASMTNRKGNTSKGISVTTAVSIDYANMCYSLELNSEHKLTKIIIKGEIVVLKSPKIVFEGKEETISTYVIEEEGVNNTAFSFKVEEAYHENLKMRVVVYGMRDGETYSINKNIDIKPMSLHHKVAPFQLKEQNKLGISGDFKYFEINAWLNALFNDFGGTGQSGEVFHEVYYESLLTRNKLMISYKNGECQVKAQNPAPLAIIKKVLIEKSKEKHRDLNFSVELSIESVKNLVHSLGKSIRPLSDLKKKSELLPGLIQLKNDESLGYELAKILEQKDEITTKLKNSMGHYEAYLQQLRNCFTAYRTLKDRDINKFDMDSLNRAMENFNEEKICSLILQ